MKLIRLISRSPNNKLFLCRVRYSGIIEELRGVEMNKWVRFNSSAAVILDPHEKLGMYDLPKHRKRASFRPVFPDWNDYLILNRIAFCDAQLV